MLLHEVGLAVVVLEAPRCAAAAPAQSKLLAIVMTTTLIANDW